MENGKGMEWGVEGREEFHQKNQSEESVGEDHRGASGEIEEITKWEHKLYNQV